MRKFILFAVMLSGFITFHTQARLTCSSFSTCDEAMADLRAGNSKLDGDGDGVPCESICRGSTRTSSSTSSNTYNNTIPPVYTPIQYNTILTPTIAPLSSTGSTSTGTLAQSGIVIQTGNNQTGLYLTGMLDNEVHKIFTDYQNKNSDKPRKYHKSYILRLYTKYKKIKDMSQKYIQGELIRLLSKTFNIKNPIK